MKRILIEKRETRVGAQSYDDIKPDRYLSKFVMDNANGYPHKNFSTDINNALQFPTIESAKHVIELLHLNSPYIYKVIEVEI